MATTFLTLAPELGGTRFGPFTDAAIALGSDPAQCHVALAPESGVLPVHAWVTAAPQGGAWTLHPASSAAALFVVRKGRPVPATSAVPLARGDAFILGSPDGVRFTVDGIGGAARRASGRQMPTAGDLGREVRRQAEVAAMTRGPLAPLVNTAFRARSGALFQPRYIVGAVIAAGAAAFTGCSGLLAWLAHNT